MVQRAWNVCDAQRKGLQALAGGIAPPVALATVRREMVDIPIAKTGRSFTVVFPDADVVDAIVADEVAHQIGGATGPRGHGAVSCGVACEVGAVGALGIAALHARAGAGCEYIRHAAQLPGSGAQSELPHVVEYTDFRLAGAQREIGERED